MATKTVIRDLLDSDLPPSLKTLDHFRDEAMTFVAAAIETTKTTLATATYHFLKNPEIQQRLCNELRTNFPDLAETPTVSELERLPYLTAVIQEGEQKPVAFPQSSRAW